MQLGDGGTNKRRGGRAGSGGAEDAKIFIGSDLIRNDYITGTAQSAQFKLNMEVPDRRRKRKEVHREVSGMKRREDMQLV